MDFMIAAHSDVGIKKKTNQDSVLIKVANTICGRVCLVVICDGMGGLSKGELASATVVRAFNEWFIHKFPALLTNHLDEEGLKKEWDDLVHQQNTRIAEYGSRNGARLGTTVVATLFIQNRWYAMNVGDSRAYELSNDIYQLTKDQTYVQREIDLGHMTPEEALHDPQRNMLLQCVGASEVVIPDFFSGAAQPGDVYLLCSDGFRHVISPEEIYQKLNPPVMNSEQVMQGAIVDLIELDKSRLENDNISAALVKII
jgi:serine/threonine protein phosphatase PrpC